MFPSRGGWGRDATHNLVAQHLDTRTDVLLNLFINMGTVWDDETIFKLIEVFETKRILWDCATWSKDYKNKIKKNDAWEEIANTLGISKLDVESKMHTLRSQFARERKKILSLKTTGIPDTEICKWKYYDALKFLTSGAQRSGGSTSTDRPDATNKTANPNDVLEIELTDTSMASARSSPEPQPSPQTSSYHKTSKRKVDDNLDEMFDIVKSAKRKMDDYKDEFDIYGQYVASELREAKDEYATLKAKALINNILIDMRMGKYKNHNT